MKKICLTFALILIISLAMAQSEFRIYPNGLIYDSVTMAKLSIIVDSLNLQYKSCDLDKTYYSVVQGYGNYAELNSSTERERVNDGISFEEFKKEFPNSAKYEDLWIIRYVYTDSYRGKEYVSYRNLPAGYNDRVSIQKRYKPSNKRSDGWILDDGGTSALYVKDLKKIPIPERYARWVQYVDCMIDTTSQIYLTDDYYLVENKSNSLVEFINWAENYPGKPEFSDEYENWEDYNRKYEAWDSLRLADLDKKIHKSHYFKSQLMAARDEALQTGNSNAKLEFYVARYLSAEDALKLKRNRRVMGMCSMDQSPRIHAMQISTLAAETTKWDIFLRAHLDVMNDNFSRMSDGSYAWAGRKTYLREIEELKINATDLLLGSSLRVSNVAENHYSSSAGRIGRALSDSHNSDEVESRITAMMLDEELDPYNRLIMGYLFSHYMHNLEDKARAKAVEKTMKDIIKSWPNILREAWNRN